MPGARRPARELPDSWLLEAAKPDPVLGLHQPAESSGISARPAGPVGVEQFRVVENEAASAGASTAVSPVHANPGQLAARLPGDLHELAGYGAGPEETRAPSTAVLVNGGPPFGWPLRIPPCAPF